MGSLNLKIESLRTLREIDVKGKRVLTRVDFNVPLDSQGEVADDSRLVATLPTIRYLLEQGARVILMSHLGRPNGKINDKLRLTGVARRLGELLGRPVIKVDDCVGPAVVAAANQLQPGEVLLLENLRFHPEEEANDREFARQLASLADVYVDDAFGTAHRAHASTAGVAEFLPSAAGFLMEKEVTMLGRILTDPDRPFTAVLGGAKIADKIGVLEKLVEKVDRLLLGGGMANTFLQAGGSAMGDSLVDEGHLEFARDFLLRARGRGVDCRPAGGPGDRPGIPQRQPAGNPGGGNRRGARRLAGPGYRPQNYRTFPRGNCQVENGLLERAPGVVRGACLRLR